MAYSPLDDLCAVKWTLKHFTEVPAQQGDEAFRLQARDRSVPQDYRSYQETLKFICEKEGLDPSKFSSHSMRRGGATFLSMIGVSVQEIKERGDWQSDAVYEYLKTPLAARIANDMKVADLLGEVV